MQDIRSNTMERERRSAGCASCLPEASTSYSGSNAHIKMDLAAVLHELQKAISFTHISPTVVSPISDAGREKQKSFNKRVASKFESIHRSFRNSFRFFRETYKGGKVNGFKTGGRANGKKKAMFATMKEVKTAHNPSKQSIDSISVVTVPCADSTVVVDQLSKVDSCGSTGTAHSYRRYIGDYEVLETLGRGMSGVVKKGRHRHNKQLVALKLVDVPAGLAGGDEKSAVALRLIRQLDIEIESMGRVEHPNIIRLLEVNRRAVLPPKTRGGGGLCKPVISIVMEYAANGEVFDMMMYGGHFEVRVSYFKFLLDDEKHFVYMYIDGFYFWSTC